MLNLYTFVYLISKYRSMFRAWPILFIIITISCVPPTNEENKDVSIEINSLGSQKLIDFRNSGHLDSLIRFFSHDDASLRYLAAESFASVKSSKHLPNLVSLLDDPSSEVRAISAYALGQQGDPSATEDLVRAFRGKDTISVDNGLNGKILESIGKIEDGTKFLKFIATQNTYQTNDTLLLLNQAKALFRGALRGNILPEGTQKMVDLVLNVAVPKKARLYAAHYLARAKGIDIKENQFRLANMFLKTEDNDIKMALALALRNADPNTDIRQILYDGLLLQNDDRVKINILRALSQHELNDSIITSLELTDNATLKEAIANFYGNYPDATIAPLVRTKAKSVTDTLYKAQLYKAYLKLIPHYYTKSRNVVRYEIQQCLKADLTVAEQVTFVEALGYDLTSYEVLEKMLDTTRLEPVKTAIASSVSRIVTSNKFNQVFSSSPRYARLKILVIIEKIIQDGDIGALYEIARALQQPEYKTLIDSTRFIEDVMDDLILPRDIETYNALHETVDLLNDTTTVSRYVPEYLPLRWDILRSVSEDTDFVVKTNKGLISLNLFPNKAPESVANFARLVSEKFYDGKIFHRVVPNFVVQTGCTRGDGYGSLNSTIHSELSDLCYDEEGYIGMASAGPNTESAQWFITLSPAPHLDGRYTIFGKVTSGMDTVLKLQAGDRIDDIIKIEPNIIGSDN